MISNFIKEYVFMNQNNDIYCNPLQLPEIGHGICCRLEETNLAYFCGEKRDYREVSDPEMLYHDGTWYMYPSVKQAFLSRDLINWEHQPLDITEDLGYAPSVVKSGKRFLLTASALFRDKTPKIYAAPTPLGPFENLGEPLDIDGKALEPEYLDPSLFADEDGRLYLYWGCAPHGGGIYGVELDPENPTRAISEAKRLIIFNTANKWEHYGEYNEHRNHGWDEGVAMFKHNGEYYLQHSACGTNFRHYALACYRSSISPLGPFIPPTKPMAISPHGIVTGTGHGGMVAGPGGSVWQFYTCLIRRVHFFERRVGMDRVDFDKDGNPHVRITSTPQSLNSGDLGLVPVSVNKAVTASSCNESNYGNFAVDDCTHTWWAPAPDDKTPYLSINLAGDFLVSAVRILWAELNLNYKEGRIPEPVRFRLSFFDSEMKQLPGTVEGNQEGLDKVVDFMTFKPVKARHVKLAIIRNKNKIHHGVSDFTVFAPPCN